MTGDKDLISNMNFNSTSDATSLSPSTIKKFHTILFTDPVTLPGVSVDDKKIAIAQKTSLKIGSEHLSPKEQAEDARGNHNGIKDSGDVERKFTEVEIKAAKFKGVPVWKVTSEDIDAYTKYEQQLESKEKTPPPPPPEPLQISLLRRSVKKMLKCSPMLLLT